MSNVLSLIKSYDERLNKIVEAEKKAEEAAKKQQQNNYVGGSSSNSGSNLPWHYGMTYYCYITPEGVKKEWYSDNKGNDYDMDGNYLGPSDW